MSQEQERINHINFIMSDIHESVDVIYESLTDKEFDICLTEITGLNKKLKSISDSIKEKL